MARIYHRDQPGAPALTYATSATAAHHFEAFKVILKACLVSGYGSIPAAGWELIYESTFSLVLRTGTHSGYVCFQRDSSTSSVVTVWLSATYIGVDANGKIIGEGARSGTAVNSTIPQRVTVRALASHSAGSSWSMVADAGTFVFSPSGTGSSAAPSEVVGSVGNAYEANTPLYCGDDSEGDLICLGGVNQATFTASLNAAAFNSGGFTLLKFPDTGLLVDSQAVSISTPSLVPVQTPNPFAEFPGGIVFPSVSLSSLIWACNGVTRALRGVAVDPRLMFAYNSHLSQALGGPALTTRTMNTLLDLGDGHGYMVARTYYYYATSMLLTTNPEFW